MASDLHIGAEFLASLREYAQGVNEAAQEATEAGIADLVEEVRDRAAQNDRWAALAGAITVWSQDGRLYLGVQDQALQSEALSAEYGDDRHAPTPMLRQFSLQERTSAKINSAFNKAMGFEHEVGR